VAAGKIVKYSDDFSELVNYNPVVANMTQSSALLAQMRCFGVWPDMNSAIMSKR
jgi:hypothetical protein